MSLKHSNIAQPDPKKPQPGDWDCEHVDEMGNAPPGWAYDANRQIVGTKGVDGKVYNFARGTPFLNGASAGADSGWLPMSHAPERFAYALDSGIVATTFSVDISADGIASLGQAFTGTWARSDLAEITPPVMFSNPLAKFFRWNVVSGGPLSVSRGV